MSVDLLPDCRAREPKGRSCRGGLWFVKVFCANCHDECGYVFEENMDFAFILCDRCEAHGGVAGLCKMPMEVYWQKVADAQMEKYGRLLTNEELIKALDDPSHPISLLAKERPH